MSTTEAYDFLVGSMVIFAVCLVCRELLRGGPDCVVVFAGFDFVDFFATKSTGLSPPFGLVGTVGS